MKGIWDRVSADRADLMRTKWAMHFVANKSECELDTLR
jgi:hypothetical protein